MSAFDPGGGEPRHEMDVAAAMLARLAADENADVPEAALRTAVGAAARLYDRACADRRREVRPVDAGVSTTAAITLACALVRSQGLTPFDFALWFAHTAPRDGGADEATAGGTAAGGGAP